MDLDIWHLIHEHGLRTHQDFLAASELLGIPHDTLRDFTWGRCKFGRKELSYVDWVKDLAELIGCPRTILVESFRKTRWGGYVYLMEAEEKYKIGRSHQPHERLIALRQQYPTVQFLHKIITNDSAYLEIALHKRFSEHRISGEWFQLPDAEVRMLRSVKKFWYKPLVLR